MGNFKITDDNMFYDTLTGSAKIYGDSEGEYKNYAIVVRGAHCGKGHFVPMILTLSAKNKETAIEAAKNFGRVKKNSKTSIIAIEEVSLLQYYAIEYINDCDPYFNATSGSADLYDVAERRIVSEGAIDWEKRRIPRISKIPQDEVKTADEYDKKYVLQRYIAPSFYGNKLVFPKKLKLKSILDEYFYQNTIELGIKQRKPSALSFYYQMYGPNNPLKITYSDKCLIYVDENKRIGYLRVPEPMVEHLESAKRKFLEQSSKQTIDSENIAELEKEIKPTIESRTTKFYKRYPQYKNAKSADFVR